jgi:transmembrane sensor
MNDKERIRLLFERSSWTDEDRRWLQEYLDTQDGSALRQLMEDHFEADAKAAPGNSPEAERLLALIHAKIQPEKTRPRLVSVGAGGRRTFAPGSGGWRRFAPGSGGWRRFAPGSGGWRSVGWRRLAVAALVLLIAGKAVLIFVPVSPAKKTLVGAGQPASYAHDLPPGRNNATLTLADGRSIALDSAANGRLAQQGNSKVVKLNGQIAYTSSGSAQGDESILFNIISTARGNQYQLTLSDGSRVWLNAASSLRFPTAFKGKERRVELTGEAYFEIAKNPAMPFKIQAGSGQIVVLGTHFNVNAYTDEPAVRTTVLEGSVAVKKELSQQLLAPGQQAEFGPKGAISLSENVDVTRETAWKDGFFWFNNTDIHTLMRQVSRWYDVEVEFQGNITDDGFTGKVSRNVPLSKLLNVLEQYEIHFKIEGKKIIVLP